ncbi:hypothetical protein, partial [Enterobacter asburiae]
GKTLLHGDVLMWLMKTLLTSGCTNQRGAGHFFKQYQVKNKKLVRLFRILLSVVLNIFSLHQEKVRITL